MNVEDYLRRIQYHGSRVPDASTLRALHVAHLNHVAFENLDIHLGRPIVLDHDALFDKIVTHARGGFCYEVNGMFAWLLQALGFDVTLLAASDAHADGTFGPPFDHLTLRVLAPQSELALQSDLAPADANTSAEWLADVGWGDSFTEPLRLDTFAEQPQGLRAYRIAQDGQTLVLWQKDYDGTWSRQYGFTRQPHRFAEYEAMCNYHQTSPESPFTRRRIISRAIPDGRVSIEETRLIVTRGGQRQEFPIVGSAEYQALLVEHFGESYRGLEFPSKSPNTHPYGS